MLLLLDVEGEVVVEMPPGKSLMGIAKKAAMKETGRKRMVTIVNTSVIWPV